MPGVNPYLTFNDNAEEAFNFYKSIFGGEFIALMRFKDMDCGMPIPENEQQKVMHVSLPIGKDTILMASDTPASMGKVNPGNNFSIAVNTDSKEQADEFYKGLSAGGNITMPMQDSFWGAYFGMCTDKFGINWMVSYDYNQQK
jgi:PhnB protein